MTRFWCIYFKLTVFKGSPKSIFLELYPGVPLSNSGLHQQSALVALKTNMSHIGAFVSLLAFFLVYSEALRYGSRSTTLHFSRVTQEEYLGRGFSQFEVGNDAVEESSGGRISPRVRRAAGGHHQTSPNITTQVGDTLDLTGNTHWLLLVFFAFGCYVLVLCKLNQDEFNFAEILQIMM